MCLVKQTLAAASFVSVGAGVFAEIREFGVVGEAGGRSLRASGLGAPPGAVSWTRDKGCHDNSSGHAYVLLKLEHVEWRPI